MEELDLGQTVRGFAAGQKVFGRYVLKSILGRGGMGVVWRAHDEKLERDVALKFLPELVIHDFATLDGLKRETNRSLELTHHHIVRIYDFVDDAQTACISMEYVDGPTFSTLRAQRPNHVFDAEDLAPWIRQICEALEYAHERAKLVHRDLKPANLMLNSRGDLKVADFGIARSLSDSVSMLTHTYGTSGTLIYMSPQQLAGDRASILDDVYSLGATIYELLTGKPPFFSGGIEMQIREKIPPSISNRRDELKVEGGKPIPPQWEESVAACLAKDPVKRPQSAMEVAGRLGLVKDYAPTAVPEIPQRPKIAASSRVSKRRRGVLIAATLLFLLVCGLPGWWFGVEEPKRRAESQRISKLTETERSAEAQRRKEETETKAAVEKKQLDVAPPVQRAPAEPWLGIRVQTLSGNPVLKDVFKGVEQGVVVQMIEPASRAAESDLWNADVLTHFDGVAVSNEDEAQQEVLKKKPGDTIELTVSRNGRVLKIPVTVSERLRSFAGTWEGTDHQFKFGDGSGNSEYQQANSASLRVEVSDNESRVTTANASEPSPLPQPKIPSLSNQNQRDYWYHQDSRTLAFGDDPQYQIDLLGDGRSALLKKTPYKDQIDSGPVLKSVLTTSRALLHKVSDASAGTTSHMVNGKSEAPPKVEAALSSNETVPGELVLLRIMLNGRGQFTLPERIAIDGLEIQPCGIAPGEGVVYEYAILPLKAGRFTIPAQNISTPEQTFQTAILELSVRSGRPELPAFKDWLNRDTLGNILPPTKTIALASFDGPTQPMPYKRLGDQRLDRLTVAPLGFSVLVPTEIFPDAAAVLSNGNILMAREHIWGHVIYLPPRPASSFEGTYRSLAADASKREPLKVIHLRVLRDNSFIVQSASGTGGFYIAGFRRGDSFHMMEVGYGEKECAFTEKTLQGMGESFIANQLTRATTAQSSPTPAARLFAGTWEGTYYVFGNAPPQHARVVVDETETIITPPLYTGPPLKGWRRTSVRTLSLTIGSGKGARHDYFIVHEDGKTADYKMQLAPGLSQHGTFRKK